MKTIDRVIHLTLDLRLVVVMILVIGLLVIGTLTVNATSNHLNLLQTGPLDPNDNAQEIPSEQHPQVPASQSTDANGDESNVGLPDNNPQTGTSIGTVSSASSGRLIYLTNFSVLGNQPLDACAEGYHMASAWEIADISNLVYSTSPNAYNKADSGQGPPSNWYGWVRTGYDSSGINIAGIGNCFNWTSTEDTHFGTMIRLANNWDTPPNALSPWEEDPWHCSGTVPVWCIED